MALSSNPRLSIEGIGSYNLLRYEGGMLEVEGGREAFPSGPFLTAGTIVTLSLDESRQVSAGVPERAEIIGPAAGVTLEIQQPMRFEWIPRRNERDYLSLVLSLFSDSYGFRGAVNCHVPDTGMFEMPAISSGDLEPDIRLAALQLRTEHQGESVFEDVKVDLYVRQTSSRAYAATLE